MTFFVISQGFRVLVMVLSVEASEGMQSPVPVKLVGLKFRERQRTPFADLLV